MYYSLTLFDVLSKILSLSALQFFGGHFLCPFTAPGKASNSLFNALLAPVMLFMGPVMSSLIFTIMLTSLATLFTSQLTFFQIFYTMSMNLKGARIMSDDKLWAIIFGVLLGSLAIVFILALLFIAYAHSL